MNNDKPVQCAVKIDLCVCVSFPFGLERGMWGSIELIPNHCLSILYLIC